MLSGGAGQTLRGHAFRDWAPVPLRTSARALIDKSLTPCASVTGPLQGTAPRASAPCRVQHPAPQPQTSPARCAPFLCYPCRWPPPTMRTRVAPRAQGRPSTATTRPAAASSPPITSGEEPTGGWAGAGTSRVRACAWPRRSAGTMDSDRATRPHPGGATEPADPVCCLPVPTPAPQPGADLGPETWLEAVGDGPAASVPGPTSRPRGFSALWITGSLPFSHKAD